MPIALTKLYVFANVCEKEYPRISRSFFSDQHGTLLWVGRSGTLAACGDPIGYGSEYCTLLANMGLTGPAAVFIRMR